MGHKVSPKTYRLGQTTTWVSKWFSSKAEYANRLKQDVLVRKFLFGSLKEAGVEKIEVERPGPDKMTVFIHSAKPGVIIGRGGSGIEDIKNKILHNIIKNKSLKFSIEIKEVQKPQLSAMVMVQSVASELEKRIPYRRTLRRNLENIMKAGALGAKIICSGRLDGAEIARSETMSQGKIPLQTLRADIDFGKTFAHTTYGSVGVKVWIYKGEVFK